MRRYLLSITFGFVGLVAFTPVSRAQSTTGLNDVLGAISNTYGTFQAAQFVASLFGFGQSDQMTAAVNELETYMQNYRDMALVNNVTADLNLFRFISSNYQSGLTNDLEASFINDAINDLSQMQNDISNGNTADAYALAPAYNLLTVTFVGAVKAFGIINPANAYPESTLDGYLTSAFSVNYTLIGALLITYDVAQLGPYSGLVVTQGGKKMWSKYAGAYFSTSGSCPHLGFEQALFECDNNLAANADDNFFQDCVCLFSSGGGLSTNPPVVALTSTQLTQARSLITTNRNNFEQDQAVQAVRTSMSNLLQQGYGTEIVDWSGSLFPSFGHVFWTL